MQKKILTLLFCFVITYSFAKPFDDTFGITTYQTSDHNFNKPINIAFESLKSDSINITVSPTYTKNSFTIKPSTDHEVFFKVDFPDNVNDIPFNKPLFKLTISVDGENSFNTYYLGFMQVQSPTQEHELVKFVFYDNLNNPKQVHSIFVTNPLNASEHYFDIPVYFDMMDQNQMVTYVKVY